MISLVFTLYRLFILDNICCAPPCLKKIVTKFYFTVCIANTENNYSLFNNIDDQKIYLLKISLYFGFEKKYP